MKKTRVIFCSNDASLAYIAHSYMVFLIVYACMGPHRPHESHTHLQTKLGVISSGAFPLHYGLDFIHNGCMSVVVIKAQNPPP